MPDKTIMRVGSLILAGGRSTRMGQSKESLPFLGDTLLGRIAATLLGCTDTVVVVARDRAQVLPPLPAGVLVTADLRPASGPLAALVSGLCFLKERCGLRDGDAVFATGCDAPFLSAAAVQGLVQQLGGTQVAMPRVAGVLQPLCAVYRVGIVAAAESMLARGVDSLRALATAVPARELDEVELRRIDPELRFLRNVNTPEEYQRALAEAGGGIAPP
jgi:molybdopterin-guanine dinucleotide biosynthesis protein A